MDCGFIPVCLMILADVDGISNFLNVVKPDDMIQVLTYVGRL